MSQPEKVETKEQAFANTFTTLTRTRFLKIEFEVTHEAMSLYTDSKSSKIAVTTVHAVLAILNIAGNSLVCVVIKKNQDMRYVN